MANPGSAVRPAVFEAAGLAEVKRAADSCHGNGPVFPSDTDDCQRRTTPAVLVHWANPQSSLLTLIFASGFALQAPRPEGEEKKMLE